MLRSTGAAEQIELRADDGAPAGRFAVRVSLVDPMGADSLLSGTVGDDTVSVRIGPDDEFAIGERVAARFVPGHASVFDAQTGQRL